MATRGFEFAYNLDGSNHTPLIKDMPVNGTGAFSAGDLVVLASGELNRVTGSTAEVTAVMQESRTSGADGALMKAAIITPSQVWKCSMDASSTSAVLGNTKTIDTVDHNTIDADDLVNGSMIFFDSGTDNDGNVLAYVVFSDTTFGNA